LPQLTNISAASAATARLPDEGAISVLMRRILSALVLIPLAVIAVLLGGWWFAGAGVYFLADSVDLATLPRVTPPNYPAAMPRIPRNRILDVATLQPVPEVFEQYGFQLCDVLISPVFDAGPAFLLDGSRGLYSVVRLAADMTTLQVSRSTVSDFVVVSSPTPGRVP